MPETADPIPPNVLASPIIGEARRFDGTTVPSGWVLAQGQTLPTAQYAQLASILRNVTSRGSTSFTMPQAPFGLIIAAAGMFPSSPSLLAQSPRRFTASASLGPHAMPGPMTRALSPRAQAAQARRTAELAAERERLAGALRSAPRSFSAPISAELEARIAQSRADTRAQALRVVSPANRARIESLVDAMVAGRTSLFQAQQQIGSSLSSGEAAALLAAHDRHVAAFRPGWSGMSHPDAGAEAARFVIDIAITPDQERALAQVQNR